MTELDALIARARGATVDRAGAERYVRELDRRARPAAEPRRWVPWLAAGLAVAAIVFALWPRRGAIAPVRIGDHVAIVADGATAYRVARADADGTDIAIEHGAVTARLWRTARPHHLVLSGAGVTAIATGTIYRLEVGAGGPIVSVLEGSVEVRTAAGVQIVHAGARWPAAAAAPDPAAERALLALTAPPELAAPRDAGLANEALPAPADAGVTDADAGVTDADLGPTNADLGATNAAGSGAANAAGALRPAAGGRSAPIDDAATSPTIKDRWRSARLLRGQGRFADALAACLALADARDSTWSPIALVEAIRIELGPLAAPERAIELADRMVRDWPGNALAAEARELRCRALRQLGRDQDCAR